MLRITHFSWGKIWFKILLPVKELTFCNSAQHHIQVSASDDKDETNGGKMEEESRHRVPFICLVGDKQPAGKEEKGEASTFLHEKWGCQS